MSAINILESFTELEIKNLLDINNIRINEKISEYNLFTCSAKNITDLKRIVTAISIVFSFLEEEEYAFLISKKENELEIQFSLNNDNRNNFYIEGLINLITNSVYFKKNQDLMYFINTLDYGSKPNQYNKNYKTIFSFRTEFLNDQNNVDLICDKIGLNVLKKEVCCRNSLSNVQYTVETKKEYTLNEFEELLLNEVRDFDSLHRIIQTAARGTRPFQKWWIK